MGRYLTAGMSVFSIIGSDSVWVDANPKETDLTYVRPGQPVTITVDAFPSRELARQGRAPSVPAPARSSRSCPRRTRPATGSRSCSACPCASSSTPGQDLRRLRSGMSAYGRDRHGPPRPASARCSAPARWRRTPSHDRRRARQRHQPVAAAAADHHLRDDGDHHAGARHHDRQRLAALHAGQPLGDAGSGELGAHLLRRGRRHHDRAGRLARQPLRHQEAADHLRHRLHRSPPCCAASPRTSRRWWCSA